MPVANQLKSLLLCPAPFPATMAPSPAPWGSVAGAGGGAAAASAASGTFHREDCDDGFVVLTLRSASVYFNTFPNLFYTFPLHTPSCSSASRLDLLHTAPLKYARDYFFVVFVIPRSGFVQDCVFLMGCGWVHRRGVPSAKPVPHHSSPHARISLLWCSQGLGHRASPIFISLYCITTLECKTTAVPLQS